MGLPPDGTGSDPTPCRPAGATPAQAMCVYGDHCMCNDGYVCADTGEPGECEVGTGGSNHCVPEARDVAPPSDCTPPCAPVSAPCPPPGSGRPCNAACWCPEPGRAGRACDSYDAPFMAPDTCTCAAGMSRVRVNLGTRSEGWGCNGVEAQADCDVDTLSAACKGIAADDRSFCQSQCHTLAVGMAGACKRQSAQVFEAVQAFLGNCGGH